MLLIMHKRQLVMQDDSRVTAGNAGVPVIINVPTVSHTSALHMILQTTLSLNGSKN